MKKTLFLILGLGLALWGCGQAKPQIHTTTGVIQAVKDSGTALTIAADKFPDGFMDAMTMDFELKDPKLAAGMKAGDKVRFSLEQKGDDYVVTAIAKAP